VGNGAQAEEAALRGPTASYLRLFGLGQYAQAFWDAGLGGLGALSRMPEAEAVELVEQLPHYPGHRARLLRAIGLLRQAAALGGQQAQAALQAGPPGEVRMLEQLCTRLELLALEKSEAEEQRRLAEEENGRLLASLTQASKRISELEHEAQPDELRKAQERIQELERLAWAQTERVSFLAEQLYRLVGPQPTASPMEPGSDADSAEPRPPPTGCWPVAQGEEASLATPSTPPKPKHVGRTTGHMELPTPESGPVSLAPCATCDFREVSFEQAGAAPEGRAIPPAEEQLLQGLVAWMEAKLVLRAEAFHAASEAAEEAESSILEGLRSSGLPWGQARTGAADAAVPSRQAIQLFLRELYNSLGLTADALVVAQALLPPMGHSVPPTAHTSAPRATLRAAQITLRSSSPKPLPRTLHPDGDDAQLIQQPLVHRRVAH